jgi:hydrogenase nickel incorporation protein HypB
MATQVVNVNKDIRARQLAAAEGFRQRMTEQGTLIVRLLSAPGSGKTSLVQATLRQLPESCSAAVMVGDVETNRDAERLAPFAPTVQITTGGACHLEIDLVERALADLPRQRFDFLFIEDVGNLICPASHSLGEHQRVIVLSTPEGDDKPGKYPKAFRTSDVLVINKIDLLPHVSFSIGKAEEDALRVQPCLRTFHISSLYGTGLVEWCDFLRLHQQNLLFSD